MMNIAGVAIGRSARPFIIAEMSGNHNQSLDRALALVDAAASAGAQGLKLQTFTADTMTLDIHAEAFMANPNGPWAGKTLYQVYQAAQTPWEWHAPLFERARKLGMVPFSTPFDDSAVDFLESLDAPCYKIASFESTDLPLLRKVAATGKPVIMSTGMATLAELDEAVRTLRLAGCKDLVLLKCTSTYPASPENTNISTIPHMRELFGCEVGLSDHTMGTGVSVGAVALGATVIEKHFTLSRADGGIDSTFSLEPDELQALVVETERAWQAIGQVHYGPTAAEQKSREKRRSIYVVSDVKVGEPFTKDNLRVIRPGLGLPAKYLDMILGRAARHDLKRGMALSWDDLL